MNSYNQAKIPPGMLSRIIQDKRQKIAYYEHLHKIAADRRDIEFIDGILFDEMGHLNMFTGLYTAFFGESPQTAESEAPQIGSFLCGVKNLIKIELDSYEFYSNIFFADSDPSVREVFGRALTDENRHAAKCNFTYTRLLEEMLEKGACLNV